MRWLSENDVVLSKRRLRMIQLERPLFDPKQVQTTMKTVATAAIAAIAARDGRGSRKRQRASVHKTTNNMGYVNRISARYSLHPLSTRALRIVYPLWFNPP